LRQGFFAEVLDPFELGISGIVEQHIDPAMRIERERDERITAARSRRSQGSSETIAPLALRTRSVQARAASGLTSQPTMLAPSRANSSAAAPPMLPPVPVITQTLPARRPLMLRSARRAR
jgi:hypothetical protein